jgi:thiol-disulfide isomerase/thioredoxin/outer membrane lipoprotein-sorting protein
MTSRGGIGCAARALGLWVGLVLGAQAVATQPAEEPPASAPRVVAPEARAVIDRLLAQYEGVVGVTTTVKLTVTSFGEEPEQVYSFAVCAERPNRLAMRMEEDIPSFIVVSDGTSFWQYLGGPIHKYESERAPASFGGLLDAASYGYASDLESLVENAPQLLVLGLLDRERFTDLCAPAEIRYIGKEELEGTVYDRIRIVGEPREADLWVRADGPAWMERVVTKGSGRFVALPVMDLAFTAWKEGADFGPDQFGFTPPDGAEQVASIEEVIAAYIRGGEEEEEELAGGPELLGEAAPELGLDLLGGGKVLLASHKGKDVVILGFWATWCPPCVRGLPVMSKVAASLKDKGVVFYAVNAQEDAETITAYLKENDLNINVALDAEAGAGRAYGILGMPHTVLIGRDGTVQAVYVGFGAENEEQLTREVQALVDGEVLVAPGQDSREPGDEPR